MTDEDSGDPVEGTTVEVLHPVDGLVDTATTDEHGWYLTTYIHKGNETTYTVILLDTGGQQQVTVGKKVKFGEADFTVP